MKRIRLPDRVPAKRRTDPPRITDEVDFADLMRMEGVKRLDSEKEGPTPGSPKSRVAATASQTSDAPVVEETPAPAAEDEILVAERSGREAAEAEAERLRWEAAEAEAERLRREPAEAEAERLRRENASLHADNKRLDRERRSLARRLQEASAGQAESKPTPLSEILAQRGCRGEDEIRKYLELLGGSAAFERALELLVAQDATALREVLEESVSLVCDRPGCRPATGTKALFVESARCEFCGGSDLAAAARNFFEACRSRGFKRVRIIGGSPTYHVELRELASGAPIELKSIPGDRHRTMKEAKADQKHADLVVLWGGTFLDHSTSGLYDRTRSALLTVAHRGLSGMLDELTRRLPTT